MPQKPDEPFKVKFKAGGTEDSCMTRRGEDVEKVVEKAGLTCASVGWVEADESLSLLCGCFCKGSRWGISYTTDEGVTYSAATGVQWKTGPSNTEVILRGQSTGTHICPSEAKCSRESFEWNNDTKAHVYVSVTINEYVEAKHANHFLFHIRSSSNPWLHKRRSLLESTNFALEWNRRGRMAINVRFIEEERIIKYP